MKSSNLYSFVLVFGIPKSFRTRHLRQHFSEYTVESSYFRCFHYQHRPLKRFLKYFTGSVQQNAYTCKFLQDKAYLKSYCCIISLNQESVHGFLSEFQNVPWSVDPELSTHGPHLFCQACQLSPVCIPIKCSKVIDIDDSFDPHYLTQQQVHCLRQKLGIDSSVDPRQRLHSSIELHLIWSDLVEFHPPSPLHNGNVGTSSKSILKSVQECRMPSSLLASLAVDIERLLVASRPYSSVAFNYELLERTSGRSRLNAALKTSRSKSCEPYGSSIEGELRRVRSSEFIGPSNCNGVGRLGVQRKQREWHQKMACIVRSARRDKSECDIDEAEDSEAAAEEWDRFESLHDDPHNTTRWKRPKYEEDQEVVWEKGGPGLVWHMDEHGAGATEEWEKCSDPMRVGHAKDDPFDDPTNLDWDVDTSMYYGAHDPNADPSTRQFLEMRNGTHTIAEYCDQVDTSRLRESKRPQGDWQDADADEHEEFFLDADKFFRSHQQNWGMQLMQRQGWRVGERLGSTQRERGLRQALPCEGLKPGQRHGLGYHGEKVLLAWRKRSAAASLEATPASHALASTSVTSKLVLRPMRHDNSQSLLDWKMQKRAQEIRRREENGDVVLRTAYDHVAATRTHDHTSLFRRSHPPDLV